MEYGWNPLVRLYMASGENLEHTYPTAMASFWKSKEHKQRQIQHKMIMSQRQVSAMRKNIPLDRQVGLYHILCLESRYIYIYIDICYVTRIHGGYIYR